MIIVNIPNYQCAKCYSTLNAKVNRSIPNQIDYTRDYVEFKHLEINDCIDYSEIIQIPLSRFLESLI